MFKWLNPKCPGCGKRRLGSISPGAREGMSSDLSQLAETICQVIESGIVQADKDPHQVGGWIDFEEVLDASAEKALWKDDVLGPLARAYDHYCHELQHDRSAGELRDALVAGVELLRDGRTDFPELVSEF